MSFMDKMKSFMSVDGFEPDEGYDTPDDTEDEGENYSSEYNYRSADESASRGKYVNINASSKLSVVLVKPESFAEASGIADHLNSKRTVVLNLESTSKDVSRRLVDFLSGVAYANHGTLKRVANCTYIITPYNVDVMGDELLDEFENNGMYI